MLSPPHRSDSHVNRDTLSCGQCDRRFSRPSHLNRHRLTHLPPSRRNTIQCPSCDQCFSRRDVLLRHLRSTHDVDIQTNNSSQRSCFSCVRRKLKCDRGQPCNSCLTATTIEACSYPAIDHCLSQGPPPDAQTPSSTSVFRLYDVSTTPQSTGSSSLQECDTPQHTERAPEQFSAVNRSLNPLILAAQALSPINGLEGMSFGEDSSGIFNNLSSDGVQFDFRCIGLDWLEFDAPDVELSAGLAGPRVDGPPADAMSSQPLIQESVISSLPTIPPKQTGLPWAFEQGQDATATRYPLPSLRDGLPCSLPSTVGDDRASLEGLIRVLSESGVTLLHEVEINSYSGVALLKQLLDTYFRTFQTIQPIIHSPSFKLEDSSPIQLATMACIGAVLSDESNAASLSASISDFCAPLITWLGATDNTNFSSISYLASLCLHQIYSLGSGNRQLYQNADRTRGVLIGSLRGLGILNSRPSVQDDDDTLPRSTSDAATRQVEWLTWAEKEKENRLAWASFEYDCSLCTLTSRRGAVDLSELPSKLPSVDCLWEAPSADAWIALKSRLPASALGTPLSIVLKSAIGGSSDLAHVSSWGKRLSSQVIGRLLWDLKQLEIISTSDYLSLPSLTNGHQQSKLSLLGALDRLLETMSNPTSTAELVSYNISGLLCHYSHLYTADDVMDIIIYIVRNVASRGLGKDKGIELARHRLISAFRKDPVRTRKLVWHAGQIIAIANEYLVSAPCEIMRLFMSYVFILAFVKYSPRSGYSLQDITVRLDIANHQTHRYPQDIAEWFKKGGPAALGSADDIFTEGSSTCIIQDAHSTLQRLRSWGLAEKFARILQCFENSNG